jgi:hypothetical protein
MRNSDFFDRRSKWPLVVSLAFFMTPSLTLGRTLVEVEHVASNGCKLAIYENAATLSTNKVESLSWDGKCSNGYAVGSGTAIAKRGKEVFKGSANFQRGRPEGEGTYEITKLSGDREVFRGNFSNGLPNGKGELSFFKVGRSDSMDYRGNFESGIPHGKGVLKSGNLSFEGDFVGGKPHGLGKITYPNLTIYEGEVREGKENGNGKLTFLDGTTLVGNFSNGRPPSFGKIYTVKGSTYEGELQNQRPNGQGKLSSPNGSIFIGGFKDGKPEGTGLVETKDGRRIEVVATMGKISPRASTAIPEKTSPESSDIDGEMGVWDWIRVLGGAAEQINRRNAEEVVVQPTIRETLNKPPQKTATS